MPLRVPYQQDAEAEAKDAKPGSAESESESAAERRRFNLKNGEDGKDEFFALQDPEAEAKEGEGWGWSSGWQPGSEEVCQSLIQKHVLQCECKCKTWEDYCRHEKDLRKIRSLRRKSADALPEENEDQGLAVSVAERGAVQVQVQYLNEVRVGGFPTSPMPLPGLSLPGPMRPADAPHTDTVESVDTPRPRARPQARQAAPKAKEQTAEPSQDQVGARARLQPSQDQVSASVQAALAGLPPFLERHGDVLIGFLPPSGDGLNWSVTGLPPPGLAKEAPEKAKPAPAPKAKEASAWKHYIGPRDLSPRDGPGEPGEVDRDEGGEPVAAAHLAAHLAGMSMNMNSLRDIGSDP